MRQGSDLRRRTWPAQPPAMRCMGYRIDPAESLSDAVIRIAREQLAKAVADLTLASGDRHACVHDARQRFKNLRGLFWLVRPADKAFCDRERRRYRDLGRSLAGFREAGALVETLDRTARGRAGAPARAALAGVRNRLVRRERRLERNAADPDAAMAGAAAACRDGLSALDEFPPVSKAGRAARIIERGLGRAYGRGVEALARARLGGRLEDFHQLRKQVKYHWMHMKLLQSAWPGPMKARRRAARALAGDLGDLNDIAVMLERLLESPRSFGSRDEVETLAALLHHRRRGLERRSLDGAARLMGEPPESLGRRLSDYYRQGVAEAARQSRHKPARYSQSRKVQVAP